MDINGKFNDWTLFTYKNLFKLFSRKTKTCQTKKINESYIPSFIANTCCWGYAIIFISSYPAQIYLQTHIRVHDLIKQISRYFQICSLSSGGYNYTINYLKDKMSYKMWAHILHHPHSHMSITFDTRGQNAMKKSKILSQIFEFEVFVQSKN